MRGLDDSADDGGLGYRPADATRLECDLDNIGAMSDHPVYDLLRLRGCLDESGKPTASPLPGARGVSAWRGQDRTRDGDERTPTRWSAVPGAPAAGGLPRCAEVADANQPAPQAVIDGAEREMDVGVDHTRADPEAVATDHLQVRG
jgi:hypothetical protein